MRDVRTALVASATTFIILWVVGRWAQRDGWHLTQTPTEETPT